MNFTGEILFHTKHGSHLYGTANADSDNDFFTVYSNVEGRKKARNALQTIEGDTDWLKTDLSTFMLYAHKGVPQYLEAMYSREPEVDALGEAFRLRFTPTLGEAVNTYRRTIDNFYKSGDLKRKIHAGRLWFNMQKIIAGIVFDPKLTDAQFDYILERVHLNPLEPHVG